MRTDATIDRKQVICKKSSYLGYSKVTARTGDVVLWRDGEGCNTNVGRVMGRVAYAPALDGDTQPIRDWLIVARLSTNLTSVSERWVNPEWVIEVFSVREDTRKLLAFFFSQDFGTDSVDNMRRWTESGFATVNDWLAYEVTHEPVK